jgi:Ca-activated chloride channel family protein
MDISGSMEGEKITSARNSLMQFIGLLDDQDHLEVVVFNSEITILTELSLVGEKRQQVLNRVSGIYESGGTRLYDAVLSAYQNLEQYGDPNHIRAIVVLTDGQDTDSSVSIDEMLGQIGASGEEAGTAIKLFTIAFGEDADKDILKRIAEATGGKQYDSDPKSINKVYSDIATFF